MHVRAHVTTSYPALESCVDALEEFFAAYSSEAPFIGASYNQASGQVSMQLDAHVQDAQGAQILAEELAAFAFGPTAVVGCQTTGDLLANCQIFKVPNGFEHLIQ
jgi:hypothetical protein